MRKLVIFLYFVFLFKIAFAQSFPSLKDMKDFGTIEPAAGSAQVPSLEDNSDNSLPLDFDLPVSGEAKKENSNEPVVEAPGFEAPNGAPSAENKTDADEDFKAPALPALSQDNPEELQLPVAPEATTVIPAPAPVAAAPTEDEELEKNLTDDSVRGQFPTTPELDFNKEKEAAQKAAEAAPIAETAEDREKEVDNLLDQVFDKEKTPEQIAQEKADQEKEAALAAKESSEKQDDTRKVETLIDVADQPIQPIDDLGDGAEQMDLADLPASMKDESKSSPFNNKIANNSQTYSEQQLSKLLVNAAMRGDSQNVINLIRSGRDVNSQNEFGETALMGAVYNGHNEVVKILLAEGADANILDNKGNSSLLVAAAKNNVVAVQNLVRSGADTDIANNSSDTALLVATLNNNISVVDLLVRQGVDINKPNADGLTALHIASFNGNAALAKYLLSARANPNLVARGGFKPYDLAKTKNPQLAQMLAVYSSNTAAYSKPVVAVKQMARTAPIQKAAYSPQYSMSHPAVAQAPKMSIAPQQTTLPTNGLQKADYSSYQTQQSAPKPASLVFSQQLKPQATQAQMQPVATPTVAPAPVAVVAPIATEKKWTKLTVDTNAVKPQEQRVAALPVAQPAPQVVPAYQPQKISYANLAPAPYTPAKQMPVATTPAPKAMNNFVPAPQAQQPYVSAQPVKAKYDNNGNLINNAVSQQNTFVPVTPVVPSQSASNFAAPASMSLPMVKKAPAPVVAPMASNKFVPLQTQSVAAPVVPVQAALTPAPRMPAQAAQQPQFYNQPISNKINLNIPRYADLDASKQAVWDRKLEEWVINGVNITAKDDSQKIFWVKQQAVLEKVYQEQFSMKVQAIKKKMGVSSAGITPTASAKPSSFTPVIKTSFLESNAASNNSAFQN